MPYNKPGIIPLYVNKKSNHPFRIIKNIPKSINKRLSEISIDKDCFSKAAPLYQKALDGSGCNHKLAFSVPTAQSPTLGEGTAIETSFGTTPLSAGTWLLTLDKEFPKGHALHKIFNRNTVKISYSCMPNLKQKIDGHNKSTLRKTNAVPPKTCNCRQPAHCPLDGNCLKSAVIYQATVATEDNRPAETYVGLTENSFKTRYSNHKSSFRDPNKRLSTELSKCIWDLKDAKIGFSLTWKILKQAALFNPASNCCNLCLWEKHFIICRVDLASLNKQNELVNSCRHACKFLLSSFTSSVGMQQFLFKFRACVCSPSVCCNELFVGNFI